MSDFKLSVLARALMAGGGVVADKTFGVTLSSITGATPTSVTAIVTIQNNPIIIDLKTTRVSGKAPLAVGFDVSGSRSGLLTESFAGLYYSWDFNDDQDEYWSYGAALQEKNTAYGPVADHVFTEPGDYTVTVVAIDKLGNVQTKTVEIEVTAWAAADTVYIANGSLPVAGVDGVLAGASYYNETTWAGVVSRWAANKRVLCRHDDTWACTATTSPPTGFQIGTYGTGAVATVTSAGATQTPFSLNGLDDVRITNFKHAGPGAGVADSGMIATVIAPTTNLLMLNLEADESTFGFLSAAPSTVNSFMYGCNFHDMGATGIPTNICVYFTHAYGCFIRGNRFDQAPSHLVRVSGGQRIVVDSNEFTRPDGAGAGRHALTIRGIGDGTAVWPGEYTERVVVSNNVAYGLGTTSTYTFHIAPQNTIVGERLRKVLVERNYVDSGDYPYYFEVCSGLVVRGNIGRTDTGDACFVLTSINAEGAPPSSDAKFYNNTAWKTGAGAFAAISLRDLITGTTIKNTLAYAPAATTPTAYETRDGAEAPTQSNNSTNSEVLNTRPWVAVTPSTVAGYAPSGYPVGTGAAVDFYRNVLGTAVTSTYNKGAI